MDEILALCQVYMNVIHIKHFTIYRVIRKSLRDFRPLRYSNRDGDAEREHVNRGRDTPSLCATLQVLDMSTLGDAADVKFGSFGKFQDTQRFLIPCPRHVSSRLSLSGEICKYATAPIKKNLERFYTYWYAPFCCVCLGGCAVDFGSSGGTYELPCIEINS
jgi:hypothetical protein